MYTVIQLVAMRSTRKMQCRLRAVCREVPKPAPFKRVNTSGIAKVKMILNLGNSIGNILYTINLTYQEIIVIYRYQSFSYVSMCKNFPWFNNSVIAKLFFMAYKHKLYDSHLIEPDDSYSRNVQVGVDRANLIEKTPVNELCKATFFLKNLRT